MKKIVIMLFLFVQAMIFSNFDASWKAYGGKSSGAGSVSDSKVSDSDSDSDSGDSGYSGYSGCISELSEISGSDSDSDSDSDNQQGRKNKKRVVLHQTREVMGESGEPKVRLHACYFSVKRNNEIYIRLTRKEKKLEIKTVRFRLRFKNSKEKLTNKTTDWIVSGILERFSNEIFNDHDLFTLFVKINELYRLTVGAFNENGVEEDSIKETKVAFASYFLMLVEMKNSKDAILSALGNCYKTSNAAELIDSLDAKNIALREKMEAIPLDDKDKELPAPSVSKSCDMKEMECPDKKDIELWGTRMTMGKARARVKDKRESEWEAGWDKTSASFPPYERVDAMLVGKDIYFEEFYADTTHNQGGQLCTFRDIMVHDLQSLCSTLWKDASNGPVRDNPVANLKKLLISFDILMNAADNAYDYDSAIDGVTKHTDLFVLDSMICAGLDSSGEMQSESVADSGWQHETHNSTSSSETDSDTAQNHSSSSPEILKKVTLAASGSENMNDSRSGAVALAADPVAGTFFSLVHGTSSNIRPKKATFSTLLDVKFVTEFKNQRELLHSLRKLKVEQSGVSN